MKPRLAIVALALPLAASSPPVTVRVGGAVRRLELERYVAAVLAGESSVFQSKEALRAMAVAARTYAVRLRGRHAAEGFDFCASTHCQHIDLSAVTPRLESIADETAGELLWYAGRPAFTAYTRDCGGRSEEGAAAWPDLAAPYLASHEDPWCAGPPWRWQPDPLALAAALRRAKLRTPAAVEHVAIVERTVSGRPRVLSLSGRGESVRISAGSFRFAVGRELGWNWLPGDRYEIGDSGGRPLFDGRGAGHGVGLCQLGADRMGQAGRSYREILAFYYPGTEIGLAARGIAWQRFAGPHVALFTATAGRDSGLLEAAERILAEISRKTGIAVPHGIELRVYPDLDTFRNATGEPGWIAGRTEGRRIQLRPARPSIEETLRHELCHVMVESEASPSQPMWLREGLAAVLAGERVADAPARLPSDAEIRQTADVARARRSADDAARTVQRLVNRYGLSAVVGWLKTGLPPDVTNSSTSHDAVKSR